MGVVKFSIMAAGAPVANTTVTILDSNGDVDSISVTDALGLCIFDLVAGNDYYITASHADYVIETYKVLALELGIYDIVATLKTLKVSDDPDYCLVQGAFTDLQNIHLTSWTFNIEAAEGYVGTDKSIFYGDTVITADEGKVEFSLVGGVSYIFKNLPFCESKVVYIPPTRSASLTDLVAPIVTQLEGVPAALVMGVGESTSFTVTPTLSNTLTGSDVDAGWIAVEVSDSNIITANISDTYEVTVTSGSELGVATISLVATLDADNGIYTRVPKRIYASFNITIE